jgi:hypothetical protein
MASIFLSANALGQTPTPTPAPVKVEFVEKDGAPFKMIVSDGREAELRVLSASFNPPKGRLTVVDNTCNQNQGMVCTYGFQARIYKIGMVWTKNSDASRLGQVAEGSGGSKLESSGGLFTSGFAQNGGRDVAQGLMPHTLECDDFSWVPLKRPLGARAAPSAVSITSWAVEGNQNNQETGVKENAASGSLFDVELKRSAPKAMQFTHYRSLKKPDETSDFDFPIAIGESLSLTFKRPNDEICQVGMTSTLLADLLPTYISTFQSLPSLADQKEPYILGSSTLLKSNNGQEFKRLIRNIKRAATYGGFK